MSKKKKNKKKQIENDDLLQKIDELEDIEKIKTNDNINKESIDNNKLKSDSENKDEIDQIQSNENTLKLEEDLKNEQQDSIEKSTESKESENSNNIEDVEKAESVQNVEVVEKSTRSTKEINNESKEKTSIVKVEKPEAPTLLEKEEKRKQRSVVFLFIIVVIILIILIFSVIFAFMNVTKTTVINGVSIKNVDVSNLTVTEAKNKLEETFNIELNCPIILKANDYETTLNTNQIEFTYDTSKLAEEAYSVGRKGNIFENNYAIVRSSLFGKNIDPIYTYNQDSLNYIVDDIESKMPGLVTEASFYREGNELIITPGKDGIMVNREKLKDIILDTILSSDAYNLLKNNSKIEIEIPIETAKAKDIDIDKIHSEIYTEPKDAYFEKEPFKIYADVEGVDFSISMEEAKKIVKEKKEEYRLPLTITPAQKTIKDLGLES